VTLLFAIFKFTVVFLSVLKRKHALSFKLVFVEFAFVLLLALSEVVHTATLELAVDELAFVVRSVLPVVSSLAVLLSGNVFAIELDLALLPGLVTNAVLQVIEPVTLVGGSLGVDEHTFAVGHVKAPLSLVNISVGLGHLALATHAVVLELALVLRAIGPGHHAEAVLDHSSINKSPLAGVLLALLAVAGIFMISNQVSFSALVLQVALKLGLAEHRCARHIHSSHAGLADIAKFADVLKCFLFFALSGNESTDDCLHLNDGGDVYATLS